MRVVGFTPRNNPFFGANAHLPSADPQNADTNKIHTSSLQNPLSRVRRYYRSHSTKAFSVKGTCRKRQSSFAGKESKGTVAWLPKANETSV